MARSTQQQLDDNDSAIQAIETSGQSYTIEQRQKSHALLKDLYLERNRLELKLAEESSTGGRMASVGQIFKASP